MTDSNDGSEHPVLETLALFDQADFFDCTDAEELTHETPEEAIADYLDVFAAADGDMTKIIHMHTPLVVRALSRKTLEPSFSDQVARWALEGALEQYDEEFGSGERSLIEMSDPEAVTAKEEIARALQKLFKSADVWQCDEVAVREYEAAEVEAMMRDEHP